MKKIILSLTFSIFMILLGGCADKRLILVPQTEYYPTFDTSDFNTSKKYKLDMWIESEDVNDTTINYMVAYEKNMLGFIRDTKTLRSNYNTLLEQINNFNLKIKNINKIQSEKKPTEIDSINDSWFK